MKSNLRRIVLAIFVTLFLLGLFLLTRFGLNWVLNHVPESFNYSTAGTIVELVQVALVGACIWIVSSRNLPAYYLGSIGLALVLAYVL